MKYDLAVIKLVYDTWLGILDKERKVGDSIGLGSLYGREQIQQLTELFWVAGYNVSFPHCEEQFIVRIDSENDVDYYDEYYKMLKPDRKIEKDKFPDHIFCDKRRDCDAALHCVHSVIAAAINAKRREDRNV